MWILACDDKGMKEGLDAVRGRLLKEGHAMECYDGVVDGTYMTNAVQAAEAIRAYFAHEDQRFRGLTMDVKWWENVKFRKDNVFGLDILECLIGDSRGLPPGLARERIAILTKHTGEPMLLQRLAVMGISEGNVFDRLSIFSDDVRRGRFLRIFRE